MTDEIDISGGGAVAVDTASLRAVAERFLGVARELDEVGVLIGSAGSLLFSGPSGVWTISHTVERVRLRVLGAQRAADRIAADLREAAAVYETIELRAERDIASSSGDVVGLVRMQRQLAALARVHPDAAAAASRAVAEHGMRWPDELSAQAPGALWWIAPGFFGVAGASAWGMQQSIRAAGAGSVGRAERLRGPSPIVSVTALPAAEPGGASAAAGSVAPPTLSAAAHRIPGGGESRVRVEKYTMPGGGRQFAVYVAGTQTMLSRSGDPFDMTSNVQLYTGERSASYEAVLAALVQSGAEPGDVVHAFGHSQGAMIVSRLALEGGYDTQTLVTFGSPVEADVGAGTLSVALRHRDDPVAALAGGGHASGVGGPGSFVAQRTADPAAGLHDWRLPAHGIEAYAGTAQMLDESSDPRMGAVRAVFAELAGAGDVEVSEYSATRLMPVSVPIAPGPPDAVSPTSSSAGAG